MDASQWRASDCNASYWHVIAGESKRAGDSREEGGREGGRERGREGGREGGERGESGRVGGRGGRGGRGGTHVVQSAACDLHAVRRDAMAPPQLTRDTPIPAEQQLHSHE